MTCAVLVFHIHQPFRLASGRFFDPPETWFDAALDATIMQRVAQRAYLPALQTIKTMLRQHPEFQVAFCVSGVALEQLGLYAPEVTSHLRDLAQHPQVEFLVTPYYNSFASLYSFAEFQYQVQRHQQVLADLLECTTTTFMNSQLLYSDQVAAEVAKLGFRTLVGEAHPGVPEWGPRYVNLAAGTPVRLLLRQKEISEYMGFGFTDTDWRQWPRTPDRLAARIKEVGPVCPIVVDLGVYGEHQRENSGILDFLQGFPMAFKAVQGTFYTPARAGQYFQPLREVHMLQPAVMTEPAYLETFLGNGMQRSLAQAIYELELPVKHCGSEELLTAWRKLTASDHLFYMAAGKEVDAEAHRYFSPYQSPYDAYLNLAQVTDALRNAIAHV